MIKIHTEISLLIPKHRKNVFPLLLDVFYRKCDISKKKYSLTESVENADILILPLEYQYIEQLDKGITERLYDLALTYKKPFWVYTGGDFGHTFENKKMLFNFRLGGFKSKQDNQTIIMPSFVSDPYILILKQDFKPLLKSDIPKIGFVGHANGSFKKQLKELFGFFKVNLYNRAYKKQPLDYQPFYPSSKKRAQLIKKFERLDKIATDFILRKDYRAGAKTKNQLEKTSLEFFENIFDNPYTLCVRGVGNFSVRFYETLAMGRIPVFLSTDSPLPLEHIIDWEKHVIYINEDEILNMEKKIVEFHQRLSPDGFEKLQISNRALWQNSLARSEFFIHIHDHFETRYLNT